MYVVTGVILPLTPVSGGRLETKGKSRLLGRTWGGVCYRVSFWVIGSLFGSRVSTQGGRVPLSSPVVYVGEELRRLPKGPSREDSGAKTPGVVEDGAPGIGPRGGWERRTR